MVRNKVVIFKNKDGSVAFSIAEGGSIFIDEKEYPVTYINEDYFLLDLKCYSHKDFYELFAETGHVVVGGKGILVASRLEAKA